MNIEPKVIKTSFRISAVLPPTDDYKWNRNINAGVVADTILSAIEKFYAAFPLSKITSILKATDIHIE